jgi:hypothetical protein
MKVLMTLVLVLVLAGCAAGKGNAGSTIAEEETTAHNAQEETTVLEGGGNLQRPPESTLSYGGREVKGLLGSYCWYYGNSGVCADAFRILVPRKQKTLTVPAGSEMVFRFGGQKSLKEVEATAYPINKINKWGFAARSSPRALKTHGSGTKRAIPAELPSGEYVVEVSVEEPPDNQADYYFRVMVQ